MNKFLTLLKRLLIPILIILPLSLFLSLLIAEKIIRFSQPQLTYNQAKNVSLRVSHKSDYLPSDLKPNQSTIHIGNTHEFTYPVKINSLGYRMEEFTVEKPNDEYRILMLGDSMTFGYGVEVQHNLPSVLKENLNDYLVKNGVNNKKIQIINAGFADGKAADTYYLYLKKTGFKLNPDLVIVNYFINNDISDLDDNIWEIVDENGLPEKISSKTTEVENDYTRLKSEYQNWKFAFPILRNSHLWILFATTLESRSPEAVSKIKKILAVENSLPLISTQEIENCLFLDDCSQRMKELFKQYFTVLKATVDLAQDQHIPIIISLLPANPQIKEIARVLSEKPQNQSFPILSEALPQAKIKKFLQEIQVDYIDSLPFVTDSNWQKYYFEKDGHPTQEGYGKLSLAYFDFLTKTWSILDKIGK